MTERSYSKHDVENIKLIKKYCDDIEYLIQQHGSDEEDFRENISLQYSSLFSLIQIGEHVKRLSSEFKGEYSFIDWRKVAGMRDFVVHNYTNVNLSRIRNVILNRIPQLSDGCVTILNKISAHDACNNSFQ